MLGDTSSYQTFIDVVNVENEQFGYRSLWHGESLLERVNILREVGQVLERKERLEMLGDAHE
jgi:hypothetical protein